MYIFFVVYSNRKGIFIRINCIGLRTSQLSIIMQRPARNNFIILICVILFTNNLTEHYLICECGYFLENIVEIEGQTV